MNKEVLNDVHDKPPMPAADSFYSCPVCMRSVPVSNEGMHSIHCVPAKRTSGAGQVAAAIFTEQEEQEFQFLDRY